MDITHEVIGVIISSTVVFILGLTDDIIQISPRAKLVGLLIAGVVFINLVGKTNLFNNEVVDFMFTLLWLIGISNTVNLIDIMDGLSAGTVTIIALSLGCLSIMAWEYYYRNNLIIISWKLFGVFKIQF